MKYENVEPDCQTFYNFIENIKLEKWKAKIAEDFSWGKSWTVTIESHDGKSNIRGKIRKYDDDSDVELSWCVIVSGDESLTAPDPIKSDIILFLWDYIIEYYDNNNLEITESYKRSISNINSSLKTLNRTKKLNNILE